MLPISMKTSVLCRVALIGVWLGAISWATAAPAATAEKKPQKQAGRIKVYNTNIRLLPEKLPRYGSRKDVSPTKYDVWYQPYKDLSLNHHCTFIIEAWVDDPTLPFPAAKRRGLRVTFPGRSGGPPRQDAPSVQLWIKEIERLYTGRLIIGRMGCGQAALVTPLGSYKLRDGTIKSNWRKWLAGTFAKEFKYKLTRTAAGQDKLIVHHVTGTDWDPDERQTVIWEIGLGDWYATIKIPKETNIEWIGSLAHHARLVSIPGKGKEGKDIVLDAKIDGAEGNRRQISIDTATQRRCAFVQRINYNNSWDYPGNGYLPFIWWEKTGTGKGWTFNPGGWRGHYQYIGRGDAKSVGLVRIGGIPICEKDLLRTDIMISPTLHPGRYRRMARVGNQWKFDQVVEVTEKNQGEGPPAKVVGSEYLYLIDDLEERVFSTRPKQ